MRMLIAQRLCVFSGRTLLASTKKCHVFARDSEKHLQKYDSKRHTNGVRLKYVFLQCIQVSLYITYTIFFSFLRNAESLPLKSEPLLAKTNSVAHCILLRRCQSYSGILTPEHPSGIPAHGSRGPRNPQSGLYIWYPLPYQIPGKWIRGEN